MTIQDLSLKGIAKLVVCVDCLYTTFIGDCCLVWICKITTPIKSCYCSGCIAVGYRPIAIVLRYDASATVIRIVHIVLSLRVGE